MQRIGLLIDDEESSYQQLLVDEARSAVRRHGMELLEPRFARGSALKQIGQGYELLREEPRPDGVLLLLVAPDDQESSVEVLAKGGVDCVFLNRIPTYLESLNQRFPGAFLLARAEIE